MTKQPEEVPEEIPEELKQTKQGLMPKDWELTEIGEKIDLLSGYAFSSSGYLKHGIRLLRGANVKRGNVQWEESTTKYWHSAEGIEKYLLNEGDLVIAMDGSLVGRSYSLIQEKDTPCLLLQRVARIRSEEIHIPFLKEFVGSNHFINYCDAVKTVTAIPHISAKDIRKYRIPLPPLPEQKKIAEILGTWDEAIAKTQELIAQLKKRNKGLAQQLLTGKKRLPGFSGEWEELKFSDVAKRITRRNEELDDTVVTISAQRGFVKQEDFFNKRVASSTLSNYYLLHKGEFAYNKSYSKGYPMGAFKRLDDFDKAVVTTLYVCFNLKSGVSSNFMTHYFENGMLVRNLMQIAQEGGRAHGLLNIGISDFFDLKLILPKFEEQKAIASVLEEADRELKLTEQKLTTLKIQKKGLMQRLLTGEVRVKTTIN